MNRPRRELWKCKTGAWSPEESKMLVDMLAKGMPYKKIAETIGRSRTSCEGHAFRLGVTKKLKKVDECPIHPPTYVQRLCLTCLKSFPSLSPGNRMCKPCRKLVERWR